MINEQVIQVVNDLGVPINVRIHKDDNEKKVAFYDARYDHTDYGQFIAQYYANTILEHDNMLLLYLDIEDWQVSHENMKEIHRALKGGVEMRQLKVIIKNAGEQPKEQVIEDSLESMQSIVGGYIEAIMVTEEIVLIVNEEGKLDGLDDNFAIMPQEIQPDNISYSRYLMDVIKGNAFFTSSKGEEFASLSESQIEYINTMFNKDGTLFIIDRTEDVYNG